MKLIDIYNIAIEEGMKADPRGKKEVEKLKDPYADTKILYGNGNEDIRAILVGVDIETPEILLADRLRQKGKKIDLLLAHHPEGKSWSSFYFVMDVQTYLMKKAGIPERIAGKLLSERMKEVERNVHAANHARAVDAAKLLEIPFMNVHTPADNMVAKFIENFLLEKKPRYISDLLIDLKTIPEYNKVIALNAGPKLILGKEKNKVGKFFIEMTGGTEGPKDIFKKLKKAGINTIISMHMSDEHFKKVKKTNINVVLAGHISSDNIGLNIFLDKLLQKEQLEIIPCSGFERVSRTSIGKD